MRLYVAIAVLGCLAFGFATAQEARCANPAKACGELLNASCLGQLGAGSVAASGADCDEQMQSYRDCLSDVVERCSAETPKAEPILREAEAPTIPLPKPVSGCIPVARGFSEPIKVTIGSKLCDPRDPSRVARITSVVSAGLAYSNGPRGRGSCRSGERCAFFWSLGAIFTVEIVSRDRREARLNPL